MPAAAGATAAGATAAGAAGLGGEEGGKAKEAPSSSGNGEVMVFAGEEESMEEARASLSRYRSPARK